MREVSGCSHAVLPIRIGARSALEAASRLVHPGLATQGVSCCDLDFLERPSTFA